MQRIGVGFLVAGALGAGRLAAQQVHSTRIMEEMRSGDLWTMLLVAALAGAFGGFIYELLMLRGRVELPHRAVPLPGEDLGDGAVHKLLDLGLFARILIGAAAAVAALWLIEPESAIALIASSLVAGTAGIAIFRSLQDRLLAVLAAQQTAEARAQVMEMAGKAVEIDQSVQQLREKIESGAAGAGTADAQDASALSFSPGVASAPALPELETISRKLGELRGVAQRVTVSAGGPVRPRVLQVLVDWSGIEESLPDDRKIVDIWTRAGNGTVTDGNLGNLGAQLKREFPHAGLRLAPGDFRRESGVDTVGKLVDHVEHQEP